MHNPLSDNSMRVVERVLEWAQNNKIRIEELTVEQLRKAIKRKG